MLKKSLKKIHKGRFFDEKVYLFLFFSLFVGAPAGWTEEASVLQVAQNTGDATIKEKQVAEINSSLKNVIEENQRLADKNKELAGEIDRLTDEHSQEKNRVENLMKEKDELTEGMEKIRTTNRMYSQEIQKLEKNVEELQGDRETLNQRLNQFTDVTLKEESFDDRGEMVLASSETAKPSETDEDVKARETKTLDLLSRIDAFTEQDEQLRTDSAKAHYNMGNIYFQKGEYEIASREYYQAVTLMPNDPDAHYNLALVSGDHLKDYQTALKHYQMYLYLSPQAKDAQAVREKIIESQLFLQNIVDSPLDKTLK